MDEIDPYPKRSLYPKTDIIHTILDFKHKCNFLDPRGFGYSNSTSPMNDELWVQEGPRGYSQNALWIDT
jgi:hypothetical protein